jgi:hypothetical protein
MAEKRVVLIGIGHVIGMVKVYLLQNESISLVEVLPSCCEDLVKIIEREQPGAVVLEQSPETKEYLDKLLVLAQKHHFKVLEVNPDDNNIRVTDWHQVQLRNAREFLALL